ncbi:MAG: GTP cyclohydrolase I FolE, partial [Coriobacteriia bacterium]|nr:GTP cyclohydrolase I FolE [Coriobacteriia bacterium]
EDPSREGLVETPARIARMYEELLSGQEVDPREHLKRFFVDDGHEEMVLVKDIPFSSICEHHLMPFVGRAHIAYIPKNGRVVGLSKLARVLESYSRRLQLQERLTTQVADTIMEMLMPQGVMVVINAEHLCMTVRGVRTPGSTTTTSAVRGLFKNDQRTRLEALEFLTIK